MGKAHVITEDDSSLTDAPPGYDSVIAAGHQEPPRTSTLKLDGKAVQVPQGKPPLTNFLSYSRITTTTSNVLTS